MNEKGFSIVELIAVVAIMLILSGTALIAVTKNINNAKEKTYKNFEDNLKGAATNYLTHHTELSAISNLKLYADDLINEGYLTPLRDPGNSGANCYNSNEAKDSYIVVTGKRDTSNSYNLTYTYKICLICSNYKSIGCN